ncbi:ScbA/BarX family gamma-butyrolactone biosynthesis protein [Streptomyces sp. NPDC053048]|uniref:ScbA/BarX family gamma-butyrolactone biosynthesis protein n=1 Tax=Streptomyces sp. NPDC053048 TaxID=3365694 RepID=UPI0037D7C03D
MPHCPQQPLSFSSTVPREAVHRAAVSEVFLTDVRRVSDQEFLAAAQLPRNHAYYSDHDTVVPSYDPLLVLEVFRQTFLYLGHEFLDVQPSHKSFLDGAELTITDPAALRVGPHPGHMLVRLHTGEEQRRAGRLTGLTVDMRATVDDREAVMGRLAFAWTTASVWNTLRSRGRAGLHLDPARPYLSAPGFDPSAAGRLSPRNVLLAGVRVQDEEVVGQVAVDRSHPSLFDHPLDHIPGAVMVEAFRQTALLAAHTVLGLPPRELSVTRLSVDFTRFAEFELPTDCRAVLLDTADNGSTAVFAMAVLQEGVETAVGTIVLSRILP